VHNVETFWDTSALAFLCRKASSRFELCLSLFDERYARVSGVLSAHLPLAVNISVDTAGNLHRRRRNMIRTPRIVGWYGTINCGTSVRIRNRVCDCNLHVCPSDPTDYGSYVLNRSNIGSVGSNPTRGMNLCPRSSIMCCPVYGPDPRPSSYTKMCKTVHSFRSLYWIGTGQRV
jgi:hypothetical protein